MNIGCFALIEPFAPLERQFAAIRDMGLTHADLTDNHDGASLGAEFGFAASVSLDSHPAKIRAMAQEYGLILSAVCAHANLLDPSSPATYGTAQIIKAIRLAHDLGIAEVITTEGEPKTDFGKSLSVAEQLFSIREKLQVPIEWAEEFGIKLLLETHGPVTDSVKRMGDLLDLLEHEKTVGICLDTGNCWLGGASPLEYVKTFEDRIVHVHWKDMSVEWGSKRGTMFGCGMSTIALGDGVVGIPAIVAELKRRGFFGNTTIEVAGASKVRLSVERLQKWDAEG